MEATEIRKARETETEMKTQRRPRTYAHRDHSQFAPVRAAYNLPDAPEVTLHALGPAPGPGLTIVTQPARAYHIVFIFSSISRCK